MTLPVVLFWSSALLLLYVNVGYPCLVYLWARLRPRPPLLGDIEPHVSVLVVALNEAPRIERRIENLLSLDYPSDRLEILVGSDGSTDDTVARARGFRRHGVRVFAHPQRRGKAAVLNEMVAKARGEILVLADARQRFDPGALRALVAPLADSEVGAVSGELILTRSMNGTSVGEGVGLYWRIERFVRRHESLVDSSVGATGAIYAVRRELVEPLPEDTILDDVLIPMRAVRRGLRVVFEPAARAYDRVAATAGEEFTRKVRTIAGNFQLFSREPWLLAPWRNRLWFQTISHKALRLIGPALFATALGSNLLLLNGPVYRLFLFAQVLFYLFALQGYALRDAHRALRPLAVPYTVCLLNWATVVAFFRFLSGRQRVTWERVHAPVPPAHPAASPGSASPARSRRSA